MKIFYCDGSARRKNQKGADNIGGWGVVCFNVLNSVDWELESFDCDTTEGTTNNREELKAILWVFLNYGTSKQTPIVYSDSNYCVQTFNNWMFNWAENGWIKSDKKTPENLDLIQTYYEYYNKGYRIDLRKVKGHSSNKWNDLADKLATGKISIEQLEKLNGK